MELLFDLHLCAVRCGVSVCARAVSSDSAVRAIVCAGGNAAAASRSTLAKLGDAIAASWRDACGAAPMPALSLVRVGDGGAWRDGAPIGRGAAAAAVAAVTAAAGASPGDVLVVCGARDAGGDAAACRLLGLARHVLAGARPGAAPVRGALDAFWVTDFPMFERDPEDATR